MTSVKIFRPRFCHDLNKNYSPPPKCTQLILIGVLTSFKLLIRKLQATEFYKLIHFYRICIIFNENIIVSLLSQQLHYSILSGKLWIEFPQVHPL